MGAKGIVVYVIAAVVLAVITTVIRSNGIILGGLPTGLLYFAVFAIAGVIVKKMGNGKKNDTYENNDDSDRNNGKF